MIIHDKQQRIAFYLNWCVSNYSTRKSQAIEVKEYITNLESKLKLAEEGLKLIASKENLTYSAISKMPLNIDIAKDVLLKIQVQ